MYEFQLDLRDTPLTRREMRLPGEMHRSVSRLVNNSPHLWAYTGDLQIRLRTKEKPNWTQLPDGYIENMQPIELPQLIDRKWYGFRCLTTPVRRSKEHPNGQVMRLPIDLSEWIARCLERVGAYIHDVTATRPRPYMTGRYKGIRADVSLFKGVLEIFDDERFAKSYFEGIGRQKRFGLGMLLIE